MTNADWWARVVQARTGYDYLLPRRGCALRKDGHGAAIYIKAVPVIGAKIVLMVDAEWRRSLYRSTRTAKLTA